MTVALLTEQQKDSLVGVQHAPDSFFNPIQDIDNNWIISDEETQYCCNSNFQWVKDLPLIEYKPKPQDIDIF